MDKEEFLNFLRESGKEIEEIKRCEAAFLKKLSAELFQFIVNYYSIGKQQATILQNLETYTNNTAKRALNCFDSQIYQQEKNQPFTGKSLIPRVKTKEDGINELKEFLKDIPAENHEYAEQIHWEEFHQENKVLVFEKAVHDKVKEVLVEFYEETILWFESNHLIALDHYIYIMVVDKFLQNVYGLLVRLNINKLSN